MIKDCPICSSTFTIQYYLTKRGRGIYCSKKCGNISRRGKSTWNKGLSYYRGGKTVKELQYNFGIKCEICNKHIANYSKRCWSCNKKGYKHTPEAIRLIKEARKRQVITPEHIRKSLRRKPMSSLEVKVLNCINKYNLPYSFVGNGKFSIERKVPDFINTNGQKIAVEVFNIKHKEKLRNKTIEQWKAERSALFAKYGWNIVYIADYQTNSELLIKELIERG